MAKAKKVAVESASAADLPAGASEVAQAPEVSAASSSVPRWRVSIPWVPPMEIEAATEAEAITAYNGMMSILSTEHKHQVTRLD